MVGSSTWTGASASDVSPRNMASTACMLSPWMRGSSTEAPLIFRLDGLDLVRRDGTRLDVLEHAGELHQLGRREAVVGDDVAARRRLDQAAGHARVEQALGQHARQRAAQEVLLAGDAPEVRRRVVVPLAAARRVLVLVLARADVRQRVVAVEREAARSSAR